jgi:CCR4-NOT transcriptional regulation complex NOT5 subunit
MRKFILITAMVLASATAQAGVTRGLTLAMNDEPAAAAEQAKEAPKETSKETSKEAPKTVETPAATEAPKFVDRPAPVTTITDAPKTEPAKAVADKNPVAPKADKPKRRRESTEARVIYELHRHGIYW